MKKLSILSVFSLSVVAVVFTACYSSKKVISDQNELVGTWQIMSNGQLDTM